MDHGPSLAQRPAGRVDGVANCVGSEVEAWAKVEALVATRQPKRYDEAAKVLRDLRDLGVRRGDATSVEARIERLCAANEKRPSFVPRVLAAMGSPARE